MPKEDDQFTCFFQKRERENTGELWYRKGYVCPIVIVTNKNVTEVFRNEKYS
jgi:hypothetical protein